MIEVAFFGEDAKLHHIGLAVRSIENTNPSSETAVDETQRVKMAFVRLGGITIELLEPTDDDSPIARSLREGVKLLHLCYEVHDLDKALETSRPVGFHRISQPYRAPVYENRRVVWVLSQDYGLFELLERNGETRFPDGE